MWKNKKVEKKVKKITLISNAKLVLGDNVYEAKKEYVINENIAELVKNTSFYKSWLVKIWQTK